MTSDPLDLHAAICRFVLNELSGEEVVAVAEHALEQGHWCDEFCALVGLKRPLFSEVGFIFERGLRSLGLELPGRRDAVTGIGLWRSMQVLDDTTSPAEAARILRVAAIKYRDDGDRLLSFIGLDNDRHLAECMGSNEYATDVDNAIIIETQRFLREHS